MDRLWVIHNDTDYLRSWNFLIFSYYGKPKSNQQKPQQFKKYKISLKYNKKRIPFNVIKPRVYQTH